jgi:hypothetical protein
VPVVNVFHIDVNADVSHAVLVAVGDEMDFWITTQWLPLLHGTYVLTDFTVTDISVEAGEQLTHAYTSGNSGTRTGDPCAANAALVTSWRTDKIGRSYRGRTYIGALPAAAQTNEHSMAVAYASDVADAMGELLTGLNFVGFALCVLSKVVDGVARVVGVLTEITELIVNTTIDSQRRRTAN